MEPPILGWVELAARSIGSGGSGVRPGDPHGIITPMYDKEKLVFDRALEKPAMIPK